MEDNILTKNDIARWVSNSVGYIVTCRLSTGFRPNSKAEIVGWCIIDDKPYFTIRFSDNETTNIPATSEDFINAGYIICAK